MKIGTLARTSGVKILATTINTSSEHFDLSASQALYINLPTAELVEQAIRRGEGMLAANGALVTKTGKYTGRTPKDKHVVSEPESEMHIWWDNNARFDADRFDSLKQKINHFIRGKELFVTDTFACADERYRIRARFITQKAWHALFIKTLLIRPTKQELENYTPDWTVINVPEMQAEPSVDGTRSEAFILLNFAQKLVMIGGTHYAGEMKKSIFTILNYLLPLQNVLSMHCSANIGPDGDTALFFGLSGTGKTTLSADPERKLIGDDEHGWSEEGIFNFEGGCYAKCIHLSKEKEPEIYNAIRFGSVLENVVLKEDRYPDYDDASITENTRCSYPVEYIENAVIPSVGGHPKNICFLTCDAWGVLPPLSRLNEEQAMEQFLLGYTAKVAGTEAGITEPQLTFSTCFGSPFLPLKPHVYSKMLGEKIKKHNVNVWLVNTGWTGGPYGVGNRMSLQNTRSLIRAAFSGKLNNVEYRKDPIFGFDVPVSCPDVPDDVLNPKETWQDKEAYDQKAKDLKAKFDETLLKIP